MNFLGSLEEIEDNIFWTLMKLTDLLQLAK